MDPIRGQGLIQNIEFNLNILSPRLTVFKMKRVVIVGGGNGGAVVSNRLAGKGLEVLVVDPADVHVYQPGIVDLALGEERVESITRPLDSVVSGKHVKSKVTKVDPDNHRVLTDKGEISYDYLVLAPGVKSKEIPSIPHWHTVEGGLEIRRLVNSFSGNKIVVGYWGVIKCPAAPFEFSFLLKKRFPNAEVTLLNPILNPPEIQKPMAMAFGKRATELGIKVMRGFRITKVDVQNRVIESDTGEKVNYDLALLDPPVYLSEEFKGLADQSGFIAVDRESLRVGNYDNVFAIGDANNITVPPKTGAKAHYEAKVVSDNILADVMGWERKRYDGSAMCAVYGGGGEGYLIRMNFTNSRAYGASPIFSKMKKAFTSLYWATLKGYIP
jgi:sulfide:quinone oxidoreductase